MNYTRITINGVEYPLRFGMDAVKAMDGVDLSNAVKSTVTLIMASHLNYCEVKDEDPTLKKSDVYDWVESAFFTNDQEQTKVIESVWELFNSTIARLTGDKKKQTGKRSRK